MQIVIDIDENVYTRLFDNGGVDDADVATACAVIRRGTPLPKGHGRLIDADALEKDTNYSNYDGYYHAYSSNAIYHAPTIIEAETK